jgi:hypothetical protein
MSRYERTGDLKDLCEALERMAEIKLTQENFEPSSGNIDNLQKTLSLHQTIQDLLKAYNASPLASLDSISGTISDLASRDTDDPNYLNNAILLAEDVLATALPGHTIPASCFKNLDKMLCRRYFRMRKLDDIQKAITFMELSVAATPVDHPDRALCLATLAMRLNKRFEQRGNLDDLQQAILHAEEAVITFPINHSSRAAVMDNLSNML